MTAIENTFQNERHAGDDAARRIVILDENFNARELALGGGRTTGRQIAEAGGYPSSDDVIVLQQLTNGSLEDVRPEELVDLTAAGTERFFVMPSDSTFQFIVDGIKLQWPRAKLTAGSIRKLARKDDDFEIIQELQDAPEHALADSDVVSLRGHGTERFRTKRKTRLISVFYGDDSFALAAGSYTTEQLIDKFKVNAGYLLDLVVDNKLVELKPGETIQLRDGMHFTSHPPRGQSS